MANRIPEDRTQNQKNDRGVDSTSKNAKPDMNQKRSMNGNDGSDKDKEFDYTTKHRTDETRADADLSDKERKDLSSAGVNKKYSQERDTSRTSEETKRH